LKDNSVGVVRPRPYRPGRSYTRTRFLVLLLFAAAAITWQFARQQPVSSLSHSSPKTNGTSLQEIQENKSPSAVRVGFSPAAYAIRPTYVYSIIPGGQAPGEEKHA
jgi:hypothetical protein